MGSWRNGLGLLGVLLLTAAVAGAETDGALSRNAPILQANWRNATVRHPTTKVWLELAATFMQQRQLALVPAAVPITATVSRDGRTIPLVIYRSHWGVHAVDALTGQSRWETPSNWSLDRMMADDYKAYVITNWVNFFQNDFQRPTLLLENSTTGTLSTDNKHVYLIEDLAVPPRPEAANADFGRFNFSIVDAIHHNRLQAFDLVTGKLRWELGGRNRPDRQTRALEDTFFLGPPLPLDGRLFVLAETKGVISLLCLDALRGKLISTQRLAAARNALPKDTLRRMWASHVAYADGILVCPTNDGSIFGVDLLARTLKWAHTYHQSREPPAPAVGGNVVPRGFRMGPDGKLVPLRPGEQTGPPPEWRKVWHTTAPLLVRGKVLLAAPDSDEVLCLDLKTGQKLWSRKAVPDDLYLAGAAADRVLLVGRTSCRALDLADGKPAWTLETGLPSGQGALAGNLYYLPLRQGARNKESEICVMDVAEGKVIAHHRPRKEEAYQRLGNLVFSRGNLLSQTALGITSYPSLAAKLGEIDNLLRKNPKDPNGLGERGLLRLEQGNLAGAVEDLHAALAQKPPPALLRRLRPRLFEALTELLQRDFKSAVKYVDDYRALLDPTQEFDPDLHNAERQHLQAEKRKRQLWALMLIGQGQQAEGKRLEALNTYLELASLPQEDSLIAVPDDPHHQTSPAVWVRVHIEELLKKADAEQRKQLEEAIRKRWQVIQNGKDLDALRGFVNVLGTGGVGREAHLVLAERLIEAKAYAEAEQQLMVLRRQKDDPVKAAQALDHLGQLFIRRGLLREAAHYFKQLGREFPKVKVRDGKTGAELLSELSTDKRFLPYLN